MECELEYKTHRLILAEVPFKGFIKITNYVEGQVYQDMVTAIISDRSKVYSFVQNERILLNNFLCSLVSLHNRGTNVANGDCPIIVSFKEEIEYYSFCVDHDLPFNEQEWYKTAYIKESLDKARILINNASVSLIRYVYPEYIDSSQKFIEFVPSRKEEIIKYKCNPADYQSFLRKNSITCLYHFSDLRNINSIREFGICSIRYLERHNISAHYASSDISRILDDRNRLKDYVHLSFERKNPMLFVALAQGRLGDFFILEVNTEVIFLKETLFTHCNAAKSGAIFSKELSYMMEIPFKKFHNMPYDKDSPYKDFYMSEVLVRDRVTPSQILNLDIE